MTHSSAGRVTHVTRAFRAVQSVRGQLKTCSPVQDAQAKGKADETKPRTCICADGLLVVLLGLAGRWHSTVRCCRRERDGGVRAAGRIGWQLEALQYTACKVAFGTHLRDISMVHEQVELRSSSACLTMHGHRMQAIVYRTSRRSHSATGLSDIESCTTLPAHACVGV